MGDFVILSIAKTDLEKNGLLEESLLSDKFLGFGEEVLTTKDIRDGLNSVYSLEYNKRAFYIIPKEEREAAIKKFIGESDKLSRAMFINWFESDEENIPIAIWRNYRNYMKKVLDNQTITL